MIFTRSTFLNSKEKNAVFILWNKEYPKSLYFSKMEQFDHYLTNLKDLHHVLVKDEKNNVLGWYSDFKREDEIWFAMILDRSIQQKGIGTQLIMKAKKRNKTLNAWVIDRAKYVKNDDTIYKSPLEFYLKNNFKLLKETRLELPNISAVKIRWISK